jgi:hypothetical protein
LFINGKEGRIMKIKSLIIGAVITLAIITGIGTMPSTQAASTQEQSSNSAELMGNGYTIKTKNKKTYLYENGKVVTSKAKKWVKVGGYYYYVTNNKGQITKKYGSKHYYNYSKSSWVKVTSGIAQKKNGKYYYYNSNGNIATKAGWKLNSKGSYAYYVGKNGYVTARITAKGYYKTWNNKLKKFEVKSTSKNTIKKIGKKYYYLNSNGKKVTKKSWKKDSEGNYTWYVGDNGYVTYLISNGYLQEFNTKTSKFTKVETENGSKNVGGKTVKTKKSEKEPDTTEATTEQSTVSTEVDSNCKHSWDDGWNSYSILHKAVTETEEYTIDAVYNPVTTPGYCCNGCTRSGLSDDDAWFETAAELDAHQDATKHGGYHTYRKVTSYELVTPERKETREVVVSGKGAWFEQHWYYKCTKCNATKEESVSVRTPSCTSGNVVQEYYDESIYLGCLITIYDGDYRSIVDWSDPDAFISSYTTSTVYDER